SGVPASPLDALNLTLSAPLFPSSCQPATLTLSADSAKPFSSVQVTAPFTVSNCFGLPYSPTLTLALSRDWASESTNALLNIQDPAGSALIDHIKIKLPASLSLNPHMAPC